MPVYEICVREQLGVSFTAWFEDFTLTRTPQGSTLLTGTLPDQAALYGALMRCRDLGLTLVAVRIVETIPSTPAHTIEET